MWNESAPGEKLLTKGEVAQLCRVEIRTVDRWVAAGKIRCYRIPSGRLLFRKRDVLMAADRQAGGGGLEGQPCDDGRAYFDGQGLGGLSGECCGLGCARAR